MSWVLQALRFAYHLQVARYCGVLWPDATGSSRFGVRVTQEVPAQCISWCVTSVWRNIDSSSIALNTSHDAANLQVVAHIVLADFGSRDCNRPAFSTSCYLLNLVVSEDVGHWCWTSNLEKCRGPVGSRCPCCFPSASRTFQRAASEPSAPLSILV